jgi:RES domain
VRQQDLLATISKLQPVRIEGRFERHTSLRWKELKGSAAGGRWGARRAFEVLYLGRPRESVVVEAYRHLIEDELDDAKALAATVLERRLLTIEVKIPNVLDLREETNRTALDLSDAQLFSDVGDYRACQAVGAAAHAAGLAGLIAPAATRMGETLCLFPANLASAGSLTLTKGEIWRGLPPDPREVK